jgi:hypothetical protein
MFSGQNWFMVYFLNLPKLDHLFFQVLAGESAGRLCVFFVNVPRTTQNPPQLGILSYQPFGGA